MKFDELYRVFDQVRQDPDRQEKLLEHLLAEEERKEIHTMENRNRTGTKKRHFSPRMAAAVAVAAVLCGSALAVSARLGNLEAASGYGEPYVPVDIPGEWKLSFPLRCGDSSLTWEMRLPVTLYGQEAVVTEVSLSPLSVTVKGKGETLEAAVESARASGVQGFFPVTICFRDGTSLTTSREAGDGFTALVQNGRDFYTNWTLHQIIDPDQVDHLIIYGGTVIPVAQGQE